MSILRKISVKIDGRDVPVPGHFVPGVGTYAYVAGLLNELGLDCKVEGQGSFINIVTKKAPAPAPKPLLGRRIALSAGHGNGRNVSGCNLAYNESDFVVDCVLELEPMLIADGAIVHLPRTSRKEDMTLQVRTDRIDAFGADICIDLHTDSLGTGCTTARGIHIIRQLSRPGDSLAQYLLDELANSTGLPRSARGIWFQEGQKGFDWHHMLRVPHAHNVIVECGFHSNSKDLEFLRSPGAPRLVAQGIRKALIQFANHKVS